MIPLVLALAWATGCGDKDKDDDDDDDDGAADSGSPDGGSPDGGSPDGGSPDGGSPDGGSPDGGSPDGGSPDGGSPDGGSPDGGSPDGGSPDGGSPDGGSPDGGSTDLPGLEGHLEADAAELRIDGIDSSGSFGSNVALGDIDGDGQDDLWIGDPSISWSHGYSGAAFVFTSVPDPGRTGEDADLVISGDGYARYWGSRVLLGADLDGDGIEDLIEGMSGTYDGGPDAGGVATVSFGPLTAGFSASDTDLQIIGDAASQFVGSGLATGDVDGDGDVDLLVVGDDAVQIFEGPLSGGSLGVDDAEIGLSSEYASWPIRTADFDGDGMDDVVVTGPYQSEDASSAGRVWIVDGGFRRDADVEEDADHLIAGSSSYWYLGWAAVTGDMDEDGLPDLIVSARGANPYASYGGCTYVFPGPLEAVATLARAAATRCATEASSYSGSELALSDDLTGDGAPDLVVGGALVDEQAGRSWLLAGPLAGSDTLDTAHAIIDGERLSALGWSLAAGDLDRDGRDDLVVSAPGFILEGDSIGAVYLFNSASW